MSFDLPRRKREPFDENKTQIRNLIELENHIMAALETVVAELKAAIDNANARFQNVGDFEAKLAAERSKYDELVSAEAAEDVEQERQLTEAREATDAALAEIQGAASVLSGLTDQVNALGTTVAEAPAEEAPAEEPVPAPETPAEAPSEPVEAETPAPAEPTVEDAPAEAPVDTPAPTVDDNTPGAAAPVPASGGDTDPQSTSNMTPNL